MCRWSFLGGGVLTWEVIDQLGHVVVEQLLKADSGEGDAIAYGHGLAFV